MLSKGLLNIEDASICCSNGNFVGSTPCQKFYPSDYHAIENECASSVEYLSFAARPYEHGHKESQRSSMHIQTTGRLLFLSQCSIDLAFCLLFSLNAN